MPLTEDQKKVRQKHFPGRRGFLPPEQMEIFRQLCQEAGCPLEEGVFKRARHSPAIKDEAPEWVPDAVPRHRKRKGDSLFDSYDNSSDADRDALGSQGRAAAAAAAALRHADRAAAAAYLDPGALPAGGFLGHGVLADEVTSGSSGEDLSHKQALLHHRALQLQLSQQQMDPIAALDPAAAAAVPRVGDLLLSPHLSSGAPTPGASAAAAHAVAAAAAAAAVAAAAAGGSAAATPAGAVPGEGVGPNDDSAAADAAATGGLDSTKQLLPGAAAIASREPRPSDDAVRGLMHLRASSPGGLPAAAAPPAPPAAAGASQQGPRAAGYSRGDDQQHQQRQTEAAARKAVQERKQQQHAPTLTVSTGRGRGRPRGRPPSRGRGRGRGGRPAAAKRESDPGAVASPVHPAARPVVVPDTAAAYAGAEPSYTGYVGLGGQGQSTLARLTHAAAMAEGMGTRGDRSRPDDYYQVYAEYYTALEAYNRLSSSLAANPMLHGLPQPEVPEKLYGSAYAGRLQDGTGMLAAAASMDLLSPGAVGHPARRKRHHAAAAAAAAGSGGQGAAGRHAAAAGCAEADGGAGVGGQGVEAQDEEEEEEEAHSADEKEAAAALAAAAAGPERDAAAAEAAEAEGSAEPGLAAAEVEAAAEAAAAAAGAYEAREDRAGFQGLEEDQHQGENEEEGGGAGWGFQREHAAGGHGFDPELQQNGLFQDAHEVTQGLGEGDGDVGAPSPSDYLV